MFTTTVIYATNEEYIPVKREVVTLALQHIENSDKEYAENINALTQVYQNQGQLINDLQEGLSAEKLRLKNYELQFAFLEPLLKETHEKLQQERLKNQLLEQENKELKAQLAKYESEKKEQ